MSQVWAVFYHGDKELSAYTMKGSFPGEKEDTIAILANAKGIPADEIRVAYEVRGGTANKGEKRSHNVMCIEYDQVWPGATIQMVALFDGRDLTEEEARRLIRADQASPKMVTMGKDQYVTVFRSLKEKARSRKDIPMEMEADHR